MTGQIRWIGKAAGILAVICFLGTLQASSPIADAAAKGDLEGVRQLLNEGADVNAAQADGMSALHWAAEQGRSDLIEMLLAAGAYLESKTRLGDYTPLHLAAKRGRGEAVEMLLEAGARLDARSSAGGALPLHFAAASGDPRSIRALLDAGADVNARENSWGQTPLIWAASGNQLEALDLLLKAGADPAITTQVVDIAELVANDSEANKVRDRVLASYQGNPEKRDPDWHPLPSEVRAAVEASRQVETPSVLESTEEKIDFEERNPGALSYGELVGHQGGLTALLHAVREGHSKAALELIAAGADINQTSSGDHTSPLLMAMLNGHFDLGLVLLEKGADPNLASEAGTTPLYAVLNTQWAPKARYPQQQAYLQQKATYLEVMKALLDAGADPNRRLEKHLWYMSYTFDLLGVDTRGANAFWRAAYATDVKAMKLLVSYGAETDVPTLKPTPRRRRRGKENEGDEPDPSGLPPVPVNGPGVWPIHAASGVGYGEGYAGNAHRHVPDGWLPTVKYLVEELGADVNARDYNGYTPLHHAAARGDNELILYLVSKGADVTAVSRKGETTADMANGPVQRVSPFPETVALLEKLGSKNNHNCKSC